LAWIFDSFTVVVLGIKKFSKLNLGEKMMAEPVCAQKAPYVMELEAGTYYWCSCGKSANQPFCDGSHKGTQFVPVSLEVSEKTQVAFCGCKRTKDAPRCDGAHTSI